MRLATGDFDAENICNCDSGIRHAAARERRARPSDAKLSSNWAKDTVSLAKFYQAVCGMQEVNRIDTPGGPEIFVNFGATIDAAKAIKSE